MGKVIILYFLEVSRIVVPSGGFGRYILLLLNEVSPIINYPIDESKT